MFLNIIIHTVEYTMMTWESLRSRLHDIVDFYEAARSAPVTDFINRCNFIVFVIFKISSNIISVLEKIKKGLNVFRVSSRPGAVGRIVRNVS